MPHCAGSSGSPNVQARMTAAGRVPATTGSASRAPAAASLRISGSGLISLLIGMKPETMAPAGTAMGNGRAAMVSAASRRSDAGSASRRASISRRSFALASSIGTDQTVIVRCEPHWRRAEACTAWDRRPRAGDLRWLAPGRRRKSLHHENESAEPQWPLERRSQVPYESRWAPCARAHEPGQGQLP